MNTIEKYYDEYWKKFSKDNTGTYFRNDVFPLIFNRKEQILDLACGDGKTSLLIKKISKSTVYGADISTFALKEAEKNGIRTIKVNTETDLPIKNALYDTVFWGDNIEHIFDPQKTITEIYRVLKIKGRVVLSTPNSAYWRYRLSYFITGRISDTEYNGKQRWEWSHIRLFDYETLEKFLNNNGFTVSRYWGLSGRKTDKFLAKILPKLFGMVLVIEAYKK